MNLEEQKEQKDVFADQGQSTDTFEEQPAGLREADQLSSPGFLELVYGVLFDPLPAFRKIAAKPPVGLAVLIFTLVNVAVAIMSVLVMSRSMNQHLPGMEIPMTRFMNAAMPVMVVLSLVSNYIGWFLVSGLFHLLAEFLGGRGRAIGVFAVTGLSSLPLIFLVPVNLLILLWGLKSFAAVVIMPLLSLIVVIWWLILLILGIRQVHGFSTGRAVAAVLLPVAGVIILVVILMVAMMAITASIVPALPVVPGGHVPGLF